MEFNAHRAVILDQHARRMGASADHQIGAVARRTQVGLRGTPPAALECGGLVVAAALLLCTIEIPVARDSSLYASLQDRIGQFELGRLVADIQRTADAVELIGTARLVLGLLEVGQNRIPIPALAAALAPLIVVAMIATNVHHAIDRTGAAQRLAPRQIEPTIVELRLRLSLEPPVHNGIDIG